jgi:hypothetical protein
VVKYNKIVLINKEKPMEEFILISAIILTLIALVTLMRCNQLLAALPVEAGTAVPAGLSKLLSAAAWMNRAGRWLVKTGGIATLPLVVALIFFPEGSASWVAYLGVVGLLALGLAACLIIPALVGQSVVHKVSVLRFARRLFQHRVKPVLQRYGLKAALLLAGLVLLAPLLPYVLEVLKFTAYIAGLWLAGRLGWLDNIDEDERGPHLTKYYNYATGKWDDGLRYGGLYHHSDDW